MTAGSGHPEPFAGHSERSEEPCRAQGELREGSSPRYRDPSGALRPQDDTQLSNEELLRYSRHLVLPDVGLDGQRRLKEACVLLIGAGGLGSPAALYLAAAAGFRVSNLAGGILRWSDEVDPTVPKY